jgi:hypothetical protein
VRFELPEARVRITLPEVFASSCNGRLLLAALTAAICFPASTPLSAFEKNRTQLTLRWDEGSPGCTFSRDPDGKYRYALWTTDFGVILAVDAQELTLLKKRPDRFFGVQLTVRYRGKEAIEVFPSRATLEFVKHSRVVQPALDPESFVQKIQAEVDQLEDDTQHEIKKHPERREEREKYVEAYQHDAIEYMEFVNQHTLPDVRLDRENSEASGWILFSTRNKWIGDWKRPEEFVLRLPLGGQMVEFPFLLPPKQGDLILRHRGN